MVKITKQEAALVREKYPDVTIAVTNRTHNSKKKTYYVEESRKVMFFLERYRNKGVVTEVF